MNKTLIIEKTKTFVKDKLYGEGSGHDWFHIERVYNLATYICEKENGDMELFLDEFYYEWNFNKDI